MILGAGCMFCEQEGATTEFSADEYEMPDLGVLSLTSFRASGVSPMSLATEKKCVVQLISSHHSKEFHGAREKQLSLHCDLPAHFQNSHMTRDPTKQNAKTPMFKSLQKSQDFHSNWMHLKVRMTKCF
ncbi:hypothetical protein AVEN_80967-1 [Araneus ventricosus]|uniref:Uncharacterized protein n=1 Tax=Araneus ventricosus TaxID=182803 RepID=A0A4Y2NWI9_ARAVE|nr:hypothetical protein AVEN_80967-1 [Araneus ventricosus]